MERWRNKWFKESKAEKLEPARYMLESLEWSGAENHNHVGLQCKKEEELALCELIDILFSYQLFFLLLRIVV